MYIKSGTWALLTTLLAVVNAHPMRRQLEAVDATNEVLVLDAPAFQDPNNPASIMASFPAFVALRLSPIDIAFGVLSSQLENFGIDVGNRVDTLRERLRLLPLIGLPGKEVSLKLDGCANEVVLKDTSGLPDLGLMLQNVDLTAPCAGSISTRQQSLTANVQFNGFLDNRQASATIFPSPPNGFGIISDVDDTIKISNVLDKIELLKKTFLDDPEPVSGMPELYAKLNQDLNDPAFFYVTGSPFQLFPFLRGFISSTYPPGPILPKNLTFIDIPGAIEAFSSDNTLEFKLEMIDRINSFYPQKRFLAIGDSTEKDPEIYGEAFRKHGVNVIMCIWIRAVDGADNSQSRFAAAFQGVTQGKFRTFKDPAELRAINVAGGQC